MTTTSTADLRGTRPYLLLAGGLGVLLLGFGLASADKVGTVVAYGSGNSAVWMLGPVTRWPTVLTVLASAAAPFVARRSVVLGYLLAVLPVAGVLVAQQAWVFTSFVAILGVAVVALARPTRWAWAIGASALLLPVTLLWQWTMAMPDGSLIYFYPEYSASRDLVTLGLYAVAVVAVLVVGHLFRGWVSREAAAAAVRTDRAELGERARLARDLHDVVAHHVSRIAVRAETAPYSESDLGPGGERVLAEIAADARGALDELRGVLGVLRRADGTVETAPQPTGADVASLLDGVSATGVDLLADLPDGTGLVAYRVVQEALTNARRHAPAEPVGLTVTRTDDAVTLVVANPAPHHAPSGEVVPGAGLTGMRERVEALGGTLEVRHEDGSFTLEAVLPA